LSNDLPVDDIGPQRVYQYYEPKSGMRAAVVIDTTQFRYSGGGVRMLPDVSLGEIVLLARSMTYKFAWLEMNVAGAKAGIWFDAEKQDRGAVLRTFGEAAAPLLQTRAYMCGPDMGTSHEDIEAIRTAAGLPGESDSLAAKRVHGLTMEELLTGYGVIKSARRAVEMLGRSLKGASIALEGLGKVGAGCLRQAHEEGARVVGVSTLVGTRFDPNGLDVQSLLALREEAGDESVVRYRGGQLMSKEALYSLPADILIPGARTHCITADVARTVQAPVIVPAGNAPLTAEADAILYERSVTVVPDFVANAGGVLLAVIGAFGGREREAFDTVGKRIAANTERAFREAQARSVSLQQAAIAVAREWLAQRAAEDRAGGPAAKPE
jgi:glutamate dehydrogenase (NAD(P)+)